MRVLLAASAALMVLLAGCSEGSSSARSCPEEYGPDYEEQYEMAQQEYLNATGEELADADLDCVPDDAERMFGTDANNATDYPTAQDIGQFLNGTGNGTQPPLVVHGPGSATVTSLGTPAGSVGQGGEALVWDVDAGATLIFAEIRWDDPVQDLDLWLDTPDDADATTGQDLYDVGAEGGSPGMPDSPHTLTVQAPEAGAWSAIAFANVAAAQVPYEVVVTVFYGATSVPDGYTAFS